MAYERILDSVLWYTRVRNILHVACSYLTYVNVEVSGKTEMQLITSYEQTRRPTEVSELTIPVVEKSNLAVTSNNVKMPFLTRHYIPYHPNPIRNDKCSMCVHYWDSRRITKDLDIIKSSKMELLKKPEPSILSNNIN